MTTPLVSVIIPTYNRRVLLEKTLDSLRAQTYNNLEVLVCDDCSSDGTFEFLQEYQRGWPQLKIFRNETNLNFNGTLKRLFSLATGEFIGMQHDHDLYKPEFIARMVELLQEHPTAGFGCAGYDLLDEWERLTLNPPLPECSIFEDGLLPGWRLKQTLAYSRYTPIAAMSCVFRRTMFEHAGGYSTAWYLASDEDLYRRMAEVGDAAFCPEPIFVMRLRPVARQQILGSWKSIYTLHLFRRDVGRSLDEDREGLRVEAYCRQQWIKWSALVREGLSLWLRGEREQIRKALKPGLPALPTNTKALNWFEYGVLWLYTTALVSSIRLGTRLNSMRKR
jgi:glycosyltransferase involved in cell wall biosynthesis